MYSVSPDGCNNNFAQIKKKICLDLRDVVIDWIQKRTFGLIMLLFSNTTQIKNKKKKYFTFIFYFNRTTLPIWKQIKQSRKLSY